MIATRLCQEHVEQGAGVCRVCCVVTFRESKQAMTRPFSTWQLREGWANLHSASEREQVPLWNSRHTSRVSHLVSRPMVILTAIRVAHQRQRDGWAEKKKNGPSGAEVTQGDARKSPLKKDAGNRSRSLSFFSPPPSLQMGGESFGLCCRLFLGKSAAEVWLRWHRGVVTASRGQLCLVGGKKKNLLLGHHSGMPGIWQRVCVWISSCCVTFTSAWPRCSAGSVRLSENEGERSRERSLLGLAEMLGSGDARAGARQRARDDSVAVTMKYSLHLRPERQQSSYPAATQQ